MDPVLPAATLIAFAVALVCTPAGVSGAVFLLPVQVGVLGVPSPAVTPTNLVYNLLATPAGVAARLRDGTLDRALVLRLVAAAVPAVLVGAVLRVEVLSGRTAVLVMIGVMLTALGAWLLMRRTPRPGSGPRAAVVTAVAAVAGIIGGAYGVGGGSVIAPVLTALGMSAHRVAPAALATTLVTSVVGIAAFEALALAGSEGAAIAPRWDVGLALGIGGMAGAWAGARLQGRLSEPGLRRLLGAVALPVGLLHLAQAAWG